MKVALAILSLAVSVRAEDVAEFAALLGTDRAAEAAMKLAELGPTAKGAVPQLARSLASEDYRVQWRAAWALSRIGPEAVAAASDLTRVVRFQYGLPREAATIALVRIGRGATPAVLAALAAAPDRRSREAGADKSEFLELLGRIDADPTSSIPAILALLDNKSVQGPALDALRMMGPRASVALPELADVYRAQADKNPALAEPLLEAMVAMGDAAVATLAAVADANLTDAMRGRVIGAMARIPGAGVAAARPLLDANSIRAEIEGALSQIALAGPHASELVPILERLVARWRGPPNSAAALLALGEPGAQALEKIIFKADAQVRTELANQLCKTRWNGAHYPPGRDYSLVVGGHAARVVPWLLRLGHPTDPAAAKREILMALAGLRLEGAEARQAAILAGLHFKSEVPVAVAACALAGSLGAPATSLVDRIRQMLKDPDPQIRFAAATALFELGKGGPKEAEEILRALEAVVETGDSGPLDGLSVNLVRSGPPVLPGSAAVAKVLAERLLPLEEKTSFMSDYASETAAQALACLLPALPKPDRVQVIDLLRQAQEFRALDLAAWCAGRAGDLDAVAQLLLVYSDLGTPILEGLAVSGRITWKALAARLDDGSPLMRQVAARGLLRIDAAKAGERAFLLGLGDDEECPFEDDLVVQYRASASLAAPVLAKGLESANPTTRARCAIMLGALGDRGVAQHVLATFEAKTHSYADEIALRVLDSILSGAE